MRKQIDVTQLPTQEQLAMLVRAQSLPVVCDEECTEFSPEELSQFRRIAADRQDLRRKQTVTLRLSPQALEKARSLGKGYTSVLSRILEKALRDPDTIEQNL